MKREILISATQQEARVAILEDGALVEFLVDRPDSERLVGDIYLGQVEAVLPGIQAAFVDIGTWLFPLALLAAVSPYAGIQNRFVQGPIPQFNVVADLVGSERPDELVIVGGHLDSWDGAQGAVDQDRVAGVAALDEDVAGLEGAERDAAVDKAVAKTVDEVTRLAGDERRFLHLYFLDRDPAEVWSSEFAGHAEAVADSGLGRLVWASPFIPTIPGTDTYTDQLW